jgi:hypothetical protein
MEKAFVILFHFAYLSLMALFIGGAVRTFKEERYRLFAVNLAMAVYQVLSLAELMFNT